jgi:hypothetical protein
MDRNLGASRVATSSTDTAAYGYSYQWGRGTDGHQLRYSNTTSTKSSSDLPGNNLFINSITDWRSTRNDNLWQGVSGVNNPCPSGFRLPTQTEWTNENTAFGGTGKGTDEAFASPLKLTLCGQRFNGSYSNVANLGYYWSSTIYNTQAYKLYFGPGAGGGAGFSGVSYDERSAGNAVRCIKD